MRWNPRNSGDASHSAPSAGESEAGQNERGGPAPASRGFRRVAKRITFWSGNLLATCVILVLGLTFGRQVLDWWRASPPSANTVADIPVGDPGPLAVLGQTQALEFGELPITLARTVFEGDERAALAQLRRACRARLERRPSASESSSRPVERRLLRKLAEVSPAEEGKHWKIYETRGPVLMVVGVRRQATPSPGSAEEAGSRFSESVVSWGWGLRQVVGAADEGDAPTRWTLLTCSARGPSADSGRPIALPLPPGSRRTLSVRVEQGGALVGFSGLGDMGAWKQFLSRSLGQQGWVQAGGWIQMGTNWHTRFRRPGSEACDVQLADHTNGTLSGILVVARSDPGSER